MAHPISRQTLPNFYTILREIFLISTFFLARLNIYWLKQISIDPYIYILFNSIRATKDDPERSTSKQIHIAPEKSLRNVPRLLSPTLGPLVDKADVLRCRLRTIKLNSMGSTFVFLVQSIGDALFMREGILYSILTLHQIPAVITWRDKGRNQLIDEDIL